MSDDEIRLALALARDPSYKLGHCFNPYTTLKLLQSDRTPSVDYDMDDVSLENESPSLWVHMDDVVGLLRDQVLWADLTPNASKLQEILPLLEQPETKLCDLTPEVWGRILETQTIMKLTNVHR
jgi:hypothetical protein